MARTVEQDRARKYRMRKRYAVQSKFPGSEMVGGDRGDGGMGAYGEGFFLLTAAGVLLRFSWHSTRSHYGDYALVGVFAERELSGVERAALQDAGLVIQGV